jgi:purine-binding chemotaxis protein CheW
METARPGQFLSFQVGGMAYGMPIGMVREINRVLAITPMPETPAYVAGVMNLRGLLIPIVDVRMRFSVPVTPYTKQTCVIVVDTLNGQSGLLVDKILGVVTLTTDHIAPRPTIGEDDSTHFINGVGKAGEQILVLIDIERVLIKSPKLDNTEAA